MFNEKIALKYGVNSAIILQNLYFWIEKNKANETNYRDGKYWTYNSNKAFIKLFPYMTAKQIRSALDTLKAEGLVLTANFNDKCDRTLWYALTEKGIKLINGLEIDEISQEESENTLGTTNFEENEPDSADNSDKSSDFSQKNIEKSDENFNYESKKAFPFALQGKSNCPPGQNVLPSRANHTNNKQHIVNTYNIKEEIHKEEKSEDDVCVQIFNFWNSQGLLECPTLTDDIRSVILSTLKRYTTEQICVAISHHAIIHKDTSYWMKATWPFPKFLKSNNALPDFLDDGDKWRQYLNTSINQNKTVDSYIHNNYTKEQISSVITNLDEVEV